MLPEKNALSLEEIDAQSALELPERELLTLVVLNIDVTKITQVAQTTQTNVNLFTFGRVDQTNYNQVYQYAHV